LPKKKKPFKKQQKLCVPCKEIFPEIMKATYLIVFLLGLLSAHAQDTIVYKNATKMAVVLKEISPSEIRYQRVGMPDGPDYVINKVEVDRVIYKNGTSETFHTAPPLQAQTQSPVEPSSATTTYNGKIDYRTAKKSYSTLSILAMGHPDLKRQPQLSELALDIKHHKNAQDGTRTGAIVCGGLAIGGTFLYALSYAITNNSEPAFYVPPAVLGGLALAMGSVSIVYNVRLRDKRKEFVDLYNE
jgi:hypothetical protein